MYTDVDEFMDNKSQKINILEDYLVFIIVIGIILFIFFIYIIKKCCCTKAKKENKY